MGRAHAGACPTQAPKPEDPKFNALATAQNKSVTELVTAALIKMITNLKRKMSHSTARERRTGRYRR